MYPSDEEDLLLVVVVGAGLVSAKGDWAFVVLVGESFGVSTSAAAAATCFGLLLRGITEIARG